MEDVLEHTVPRAEDQRECYKLPSKKNDYFLGLFLIDRADVDPHFVYLGFHNLVSPYETGTPGRSQPSVETPCRPGGVCVCPTNIHRKKTHAWILLYLRHTEQTLFFFF